MDLSKISLDLLKAEHEAVDAMRCSDDWAEMGSPICRSQSGQEDICPLDACLIDDVCEGMCDAYGWPERKERYLLELRAEIERRSACE